MNLGLRSMKKNLMKIGVALCLVLALMTVWINFSFIQYQVDGEIFVATLDEQVTVRRDAYGIPYIFAKNKADLIRAQGFISAQDRLLQLELNRRAVTGHLAELLGERALKSDTRSRVMGYYRAAQRHERVLSDNSRAFLRWYVEGVNAYITTRTDEFPLDLKILGAKDIKPWTVTDALALLYFGGSTHGTNVHEELLSQALNDELGPQAFADLTPVSINPDREIDPLKSGFETISNLSLSFDGLQPYPQEAPPIFGSNNWALSPQKTTSGRAMLTNDPHLKTSLLPGFLYPVGLFAPGINAVGGASAGIGGLVLGRTDHVAFGVTNAYGDSQDVYIEKIDPQDQRRYLEGDQSYAFETREEVIRVKQGNEYNEKKIIIRKSHRGPIISDHEVFGVIGHSVLSSRWSTLEHHNPELGFDQILEAKNVGDLERAVFDIDLIFLNFVFADKDGNIGHRASGLIPIRKTGGATPQLVATEDNWTGWIPKNKMPGGLNPDRQWIGTANHDTRGDAYPYYYSSKFSPHYRYSRMIEVLDSKKTISAQESWDLTLDTKNMLAEKLTPNLSGWLKMDSETKLLGDLLETWDFYDDPDSIGATVFHTVYEQLITEIFKDEMSPELYLQFKNNSRYYWQQRIDDALVKGESRWFDNVHTPQLEQAGDLAVVAGRKALVQLKAKLGNDSGQWQWGKASKMIFFSPLRQRGIGRNLLGGGEYPGRGSNETINRGSYKTKNFPYTIKNTASLRMVADFSDDNKVMGIVAGGNAARTGHPSMTSQLEAYINGGWIPWWRNEQRIVENTEHILVLSPRNLTP